MLQELEVINVRTGHIPSVPMHQQLVDFNPPCNYTLNIEKKRAHGTRAVATAI